MCVLPTASLPGIPNSPCIKSSSVVEDHSPGRCSTRMTTDIPGEECTLMAASFDAIIIGAGHNGLVTACYLAKAGWKVLVLERRHVVGGARAPDEGLPRLKLSTLALF